MALIGNHNSKLNLPYFSMSVKSCLYKTVDCTKYCSATHGRHHFKSVQDSMERKYLATFEDDFVDNIVAEITNLRRFRIHSAGDFYSQEYYNKWCEIAKRIPNTRFLAYTRNTDIDFSSRPDNLNIIFSVDESTIEFNYSVNAFAMVEYEPPKDIRHLQKYAKLGKICNSKCVNPDTGRECDYCWRLKEGVIFFPMLKSTPKKIKEELIQLTT